MVMSEWSNYLTFKRIFELAKHCCGIASEKGFDIRTDIKENKNLVNDIRSWLLRRKLEDRVGDVWNYRKYLHV